MKITDIIIDNFLTENVDITYLGTDDRPWYKDAYLEKFPDDRDHVMNSDDWDSFAGMVGTHLASGSNRHVWRHRLDPNLVIKTPIAPTNAYGNEANECEQKAWKHWQRTKFKHCFCPVKSWS